MITLHFRLAAIAIAIVISISFRIWLVSLLSLPFHRFITITELAAFSSYRVLYFMIYAASGYDAGALLWISCHYS
jgi:hypothetical protein